MNCFFFFFVAGVCACFPGTNSLKSLKIHKYLPGECKKKRSPADPNLPLFIFFSFFSFTLLNITVRNKSNKFHTIRVVCVAQAYIGKSKLVLVAEAAAAATASAASGHPESLADRETDKSIFY